MGSIHIGICHDYDLIVVELADIKVITEALRETASEGIDHSLDLCVLKYLCYRHLLNIEDLTSKWKYGLIFSVTGCLGRAAGGITLDYKDLALLCIVAFLTYQLSVAFKRELAEVNLSLGLSLLLSCLYCLIYYISQYIVVSVEVYCELLTHDSIYCVSYICIGQSGLSLSFKLWVRMLYGYDSLHTLSYIST